MLSARQAPRQGHPAAPRRREQPGRTTPGGAGLSALPARCPRRQPGRRSRLLTAPRERLQQLGRRKFPRPARAGARRFLKPDVTPSGPSGDPRACAPRPSPLPGDSPSPPSSAPPAGSSASSYPGGRRGPLLAAPLSSQPSSAGRCPRRVPRPPRCRTRRRPCPHSRSELPAASGGSPTAAAATGGSDALTDSLINNNKDTESEQAGNFVDETRGRADSSWLFSRSIGQLTGIKLQET
ncbi:translation initiation factor IF-2-like isoform X1 [Vidua chalybeata]|uniref:translation initiation factor IF-2-like isoform X1 n=1 Tax=Vidua chalybeata TaxID=81927 RepID=UPI0023A90BE5|nr:translation initiation factor IF-2-like isoform X1 [Vidua chalybeata]